MFLRQIKRVPVLLGLFASYSLYYRQKANAMANDFKNIQDKDLTAYLIHPEFYANSLIFFDSFKQAFLSFLPKAKLYQVSKGEKQPDEEVKQFIQQYDMVAINGEGDCRPFKLLKNHDITRLQNFLRQVPVLESIDEFKQLLSDEENKLVLSFIPASSNASKSLSGTNNENTNDFDTFRKSNSKDLTYLEQFFKELRYRNLDKTAGHMIIRDPEVAQFFGLSKDDAGQIYVVKKSSLTQGNESSFVLDKVEYNMTRIEPDSSLESVDEFLVKTENDYNDMLYKLLKVKKRPIATNQFDVSKVLRRLSLRLLPYVSHVYSDQQLNNLMILASQMNISKILVYGVQNDDDQLKYATKKLVNLKRSLNIKQQERLLIILSENAQLLHKYFGMIGESSTQDSIRLLNLEKPRFEAKKDYELVQLSEAQEELLDIQEEIHQQSLESTRYRFFGKPTVGRLKYFIGTAIPDLQLSNLVVPKEQTVFEEYHESTNYSNLRTNSETLTSKDIETQLLNGIENSNSLVYFYKPHCGSCYMVSRSFEEMGKELNVISTFAKDVSEGKVNYRNFDENILNHHRIQNYRKFVDLRLFRYNILNENKDFSPPTKTPGLYYFKNGKVIPVEFLKQQIKPNDSSKLLWFTLRIIDTV